MESLHTFARSTVGGLLKNALLLLLGAIIALWIVRAMQSRSLPELRAWHAEPLTQEFRTNAYPEGIALPDYVALETRLKSELDHFVRTAIPEPDLALGLRYAPEGHPFISPADEDWNRTVIWKHDQARGAAVLVHGASDSPYSMRTLATRLHRDGLTVIALRLPGHGTVPSALKSVTWEDWQATVISAVSFAAGEIEATQPLYLVGYSTGAALSLNYALNAVQTPSLRQVEGLILISPAIGITSFAALANLDLALSTVPGWHKFAWTSISPEFDPFKYNSFPKHTGRETFQLTQENQRLLASVVQRGAHLEVPPVLTFVSAVDATVSVSAVIDNLYHHLGPGRHELVVFDVNRTSETLGFLKSGALDLLEDEQQDPTRRYDLTILSNRHAQSPEVVATTYCAQALCTRVHALDVRWPATVFSLSHVALPFSPEDPIYGAADSARLSLGALQPRGERDILIVPVGQLMRLRYNPFIDYVLETTTRFTQSP